MHPLQDLSEVELPLLGAAVAEGPADSRRFFFSAGRVHGTLDVQMYMAPVYTGPWSLSGEAIEDHKIQELAHLTKMMQIQQEMDLKVEKMLFLGLTVCSMSLPYSPVNIVFLRCWDHGIYMNILEMLKS